MTALRHATTSYKALAPFIQGMDSENNHRKFTSGEYMPLVIEWLYYNDYKGRPVFSIAHYGEQNGDLMRDPEMTVAIDFDAGAVEPLTWRNDYIGRLDEVYKRNNAGQLLYSQRLRTSLDEFLWQWLKNIKYQGFNPNQFT